jgi:hypothetical protein
LKPIKTWLRDFRLLGLIVLLVSATSVGVLASYALQPEEITLEIKEPIEILEYPSGFSLFPGETVEFNVTVLNQASINYLVTLVFRLNDTEYQARYVTFCNESYTVVPGTQSLAAWLTVSPAAPPANLLLSISLVRGEAQAPESPESPSPSPPSSQPTPLSPSLLLLGSGARWAARDGDSALVISWKDNWEVHHLTDGADWGPWPDEAIMNNWSLSISQALERSGFNVESVGDIPENLSDYDLVVIFAYWAVEPRHSALIRDYVSNGGSAVILAGVPCYLNVYCKDWWPYGASGLPYEHSENNWASMQEWLGSGSYMNAGGTVRASVNNPFGTAFLIGDTLYHTEGYSAAAVGSLANDTQVIALWDSGSVFAFAHEYGQGRVYYQAAF